MSLGGILDGQRTPTERLGDSLIGARAGSQDAWREVFAFVEQRLIEIVRTRLAGDFRFLKRWIDENDAISAARVALWPYLAENTPRSTAELYKMAAFLVQRVLVDFVRKQRGSNGFGRRYRSWSDDPDAAGGPVFDRVAGQSEDPTRSVEIEELVEAVGRLPMNHRMAVSLRYFNQMTLEQVAETMEVSVGKASALIIEGEGMLGRIYKGDE